MKRYFKYSILLTLVLMMTIGLVYAPAPVVPIGQAEQTVPFESNPTVESHSGGASPAVTDPDRMMDGDTSNKGTFRLNFGFAGTGWVKLSDFNVPAAPEPFVSNWIDIKMKYEVSTPTSDDYYSIEYSIDGINWVFLQTTVSGDPDSKFTPAITRPWAQVADLSGDGVWSWTEISDLQVRFYCDNTGGWDNTNIDIYELWVSVYPSPLPPSLSTAVSIWPSDVGAREYCFIDVYAMDLGWDWPGPDPPAGTYGLWGYEVHILYDTIALTALEYLTYYPFKTDPGVSAIDDSTGLVSVSMYTFAGDSEGFVGNTPLFRVYFQTDTLGTSGLIIDYCELKPAALDAVFPTTHDGFVRTGAIMSAVAPGASKPTPPYDPDVIDPSMPPEQEVYWHEIWPTYCNLYEQTSFIDNGDGYLSPSDQIDVWDYQLGVTKWWHVEEVTTTIWITVPDIGYSPVADAEPPIYPEYPNPIGNPIGTTWHWIYPPDFYCTEFTITDWLDSDGGGYLSPCDDILADFGPLGSYVAHVDDISTDIIVTEKPPPVPEFPLGVGLMIAIAPAIPIVYLWRTRKKEVMK